MQLDEPEVADWYVPEAQVVQSNEPAAENVPAAQL